MSTNLDKLLSHMEEKTPTFKIPMLFDERKASWIRPFKTKDQKLAVILRDEGNTSDLVNFENIINLLDEVVVQNDVPISDWPVQDFIYFLIQFRIKALGEMVEMTSPCKNASCTEKGNFQINLIKDASILKAKKIDNNILNISDKMKLMLKLLTVEDMHKILRRELKDRELIGLALAVKDVEFDGEIISLTDEEKLKVIEELTKEQAEQILKFAQDYDYGVTIEKKWKCKTCNTENTDKFNGFEIINFF